eukprot:12117821-Heterocapsa_arctica.AAC.1
MGSRSMIRIFKSEEVVGDPAAPALTHETYWGQEGGLDLSSWAGWPSGYEGGGQAEVMNAQTSQEQYLAEMTGGTPISEAGGLSGTSTDPAATEVQWATT